MPDGKKKKIGVLVRNRNAEALRMALGLTLLGDEVNVFIMDDPPEVDESVSMSIQGLRDMGARIVANRTGFPYETMSTEEVARAMLDFDVIIPY